MRTLTPHLRLTTAFAAALVANAGETLAAPLPAFPVAAPSEQVQSEQDRRIMRALAGPHIPAGVQGMRRFGVGSGIFIAPNRVLSNFHVAGECRALTVGNNTEGEEVDAALLAGDPQQDLVVLSADEPDVHPAQFLTAGFKQSQDDLAIVGYPEHGLPVLQAELYRASVFQDDLEKPGPRYSFFGNVRRGNSGGPLLNAQGAVVGVVTAKIDTVAVYRKTGEVIDDLGIAISNRTVFDFLAANHIPFEPAAERPKLSSDELLQLAHGFVRQVSCWK